MSRITSSSNSFQPSTDLFDQRFVHRREIEAARQHFQQLFAVVGDAAAGAAERERRTKDDRKSDLARELSPSFRLLTSADFGTSRPMLAASRL